MHTFIIKTYITYYQNTGLGIEEEANGATIGA
jgi:hypothetical protein